MKKRRLYEKLMSYAKKNPDGFTVKIKDGKIRSVEPNKLNRFVVSKTNNNTIQKIKQSFRDDDYSGFAGGWLDQKTGKYYIDKNLVFGERHKEKAIKTGYKYNQLEIFDLHTFETIKLQKKHGEWKLKQKRLKEKQAKIKKPVVMRKGKWYNKITKRYVSKTYAKRINSYFSRHPESTLHEGTGHGKYSRDIALTEHSKEIREMAFGKGTQLIKTKTRTGKIVHFSPFYHEQLTQEKLSQIKKLDYTICNNVDMELFRMTRIKDNIYHIATWEINQRLVSPISVDLWSVIAWKKYNCITSHLKKVYNKYPFSKITIMYGHITCYFISKYDGWEKGRTFGFVIPNKSGFRIMKEHFNDILDFYKNRLEVDAYHEIVVMKVNFYLYDDIDNASKQAKDISKYRMGVNRIMK